MTIHCGQPVPVPDSVVTLPLNVRIRNYRGRTLLGGYEHVFELSESAAFMCRQLDGERSLRGVGLAVAAEYDVDAETATRDAVELFTRLAAHDLVIVRR